MIPIILLGLITGALGGLKCQELPNPTSGNGTFNITYAAENTSVFLNNTHNCFSVNVTDSNSTSELEYGKKTWIYLIPRVEGPFFHDYILYSSNGKMVGRGNFSILRGMYTSYINSIEAIHYGSN